MLDNGIRAVVFDPARKVLAAGGFSDRIQLCESHASPAIHTIQHQGDITSVAFHPNGLQFASGSQDHTARIWDVTTDQPGLQVSHESVIKDVMFSPNRQLRSQINTNGDRQKTHSNKPHHEIARIVRSNTSWSGRSWGNKKFLWAQQMLRIVRRLNPNDAEAFSDLGLTYMAQDQSTDAINALQKAIVLRPGDSEAPSRLELAEAFSLNE